MKLIIAEKPELGKLIAAAIPGEEEHSGPVIRKGDCCVISAFGHLLGLKAPADYDARYKTWKIEDLPIYFDNWEVVPKTSGGKGDQAKQRLKLILELIDKASVIIHAGDPDDEGQLLIDEILRYSKTTKPVYRLNTGDTTQTALNTALKSLTPNKAHEAAGWAAYARAVADFAVGINLSRYFSVTNKVKLIVGRVQTPTLGMVVARDRLIEDHVKQTYYDILVQMLIDGHSVKAKFVPPADADYLDEKKILDKAVADRLASRLTGKTYETVISEKTFNEAPPLPFDLVELQSIAGAIYKYSPQRVLDLTQNLRDKWNAITYNRSECRYLHESQWPEAPATAATVCSNIGKTPAGMSFDTMPAAYNDKKADSAHSGIIPQNVSLDLHAMPAPERNIYYLICRNFLAQFLPDAKKKTISLRADTEDGGRIIASHTDVISDGYRILFKKAGNIDSDDSEKKDEDSSELAALKPGKYPGFVENAEAKEKQTNPPPRYTQTTLNKDMTRISKYVDDPRIKSLLLEKDKGKKGESGSIGTPATRASIITGLISKGYLKEDSSKHLISTDLGRELIRILPTELTSPTLTADWWVIQQRIKEGTAGWTDLTGSVLDMIRKTIGTKYPTVDPKYIPQKSGRSGSAARESLGKCPLCGGEVYENSRAFGCSNWKNGCRFTIWKSQRSGVFSKTRITAANAKNLLAGKKIHKKGLISTKGTVFDADIVLAVENGRADLKLVFDNKPR